MHLKSYNFLFWFFITNIASLSAQDSTWVIFGIDGEQKLMVTAADIKINGDEIWFKENGLYGCRDFNNRIIIAPKYESVKMLKAGFTEVYNKGCRGIVKGGKEIIPLKNRSFDIKYDSDTIIAYEGCDSNPEAYIIQETMYYDLDGNLLSRPMKCGIFTEMELDRPYRKTEKLKVHPSIYRYCNIPTDSLLEYFVTKTISHNFKLVAFVERISSPNQDVDYEIIFGILNSRDSMIYIGENVGISDIHNGLFQLRFTTKVSPFGREPSYLLMDTTGNILPGRFDYTEYNPYNRTVTYRVKNEWGLYRKGNPLKTFHRATAGKTTVLPVNALYYLVFDHNSTTLLMDTSGNKIILDLDMIYQYNEYCLKVQKGDRKVFMNYNLKEFEYTHAEDVKDFAYERHVLKLTLYGQARCGASVDHPLVDQGYIWTGDDYSGDRFQVIKSDSLLGLFDTKSFEVIIKPEYDEIYKANDSYFVLKKDGKWGLSNSTGKIILPVRYSKIQIFDNYFAVEL